MILETVPASHPHELTGHPVSNQAARHYAGALGSREFRAARTAVRFPELLPSRLSASGNRSRNGACVLPCCTAQPVPSHPADTPSRRYPARPQ